jgi:hypothetical protein
MPSPCNDLASEREDSGFPPRTFIGAFNLDRPSFLAIASQTMKKTLTRSITLFLFSAFVFVANLRADSLDIWTARSSPTTPYLNDVAWGNGIYVGIGNQILTSEDGNTWTRQAEGLAVNTVSFANDKNVFIAIRSPKSFFLSGDGTNWTQRSISTTETILSAAEGVGKFVMSGTGGNIWISDDAIDWKRTRVSDGSEDFSKVSFCAGMFFVVAQSGIWISTNAVQWTPIMTIQNCGRIAFGNSVYVAACGDTSYVSTNGIKWQKSDFTGSINDVAYSLGFFIACGNGNLIWTSRDGLNWTGRTPPVAAPNLRAVASNSENVVIVGQQPNTGGGYIN